MFYHKHPYKPFLFKEATKLIVGTLPPPRFTGGDLKSGDVDFCYGSRDGYLWPILDRIFNLELLYETSRNAIIQRKQFLKSRKIGICDIVESASREKVDASDLGMSDVVLRDLLHYLRLYPSINTLLFTGGNSKNGPEYFFRKLLKQEEIKLLVVSDEIPRIHQFDLPLDMGTRKIHTVSLIAPSGAANRAIGSIAAYKAAKQLNPDYTTIDFRIAQYREYF